MKISMKITMKKEEVKEYLLPIEVGKTVIEGQAGKVISHEPYIKLLNNPTWNGKLWECAAQIESTLCLISVKPYRKKGVKDNDAKTMQN